MTDSGTGPAQRAGETQAAKRKRAARQATMLGALALLLLVPPAVAAQGDGLPSGEGAVIPGHYIVVLEDSVDHPAKVANAQTEAHDGNLGLVYRHALKGYSATLSGGAVESLRRNPSVRYVTPDRVVEAESNESESEGEGEGGPQTVPTGIARIFAPANESLHIDGKDDYRVDADVAVIDGGIDFRHPDLNVTARTNCVPTYELFEGCVDSSGPFAAHATHVAGTIGALDNGFGVVGVAPGARLWSVRVLNLEGRGLTSWTIGGVDWVTAHADRIEAANMSIGCKCKSLPLQEAIEASAEAGVVYTLAAGNRAEDVENDSPAGNPDAITVSALADYDGKSGGEASPTCKDRGADDSLAVFSNWGEGVNVAAPGVCIYSTEPGGTYGTKSGTSMAAPHVAGAAAILASVENPEDLEDVERIRQTIEEEGNQAWEDTSGDGIQEPLLDVGNEAVFAARDQVAVTGQAAVLSSTEATLRGAVNPAGLETEYHFEYGPTTAYGASIPASGASAGSGGEYSQVEQALEGLEPHALYHYRVVATNAEGTFNGADRTFLTAVPTASTEAATGVKTTTATLNATGNPEGVGTYYWFEYGETTSYGAKTSIHDVRPGTSGVTVKNNISELSQGTTYHYRVVAESETATVKGEDRTLTTLKLPKASTEAATGVKANQATLNATVNPEGSATDYWFEYGETTSYGTKVPVSPESAGSGTSGVAVSQPLVGLGFGTTYHYRVVAESEAGKAEGEDQAFETEAPNLAGVAVTEPFDGSSASLERFGSKWSALAWAEGSTPKGEDSSTGWAPKDTYLALNGAFYSPTFSDAGWGLAAVATMAASPNKAERYFSLWLDMPTPAGTKAGYELRFYETDASANEYTVTLSKWAGGTQTVLASKWNYTFVAGSSLALLDAGGTVAAWTDTGSGFAKRLSAADSSFSEGNAGLSGVGVNTRLTDFRAGRLGLPGTSTETATGVQPSQATLNATVNPEGLPTSYWFEYGPTTAYGAEVPASPEAIGSGTSALAVSQTPTGLSENTTYHYRVVAESEAGTAYGEDNTFVTGDVGADLAGMAVTEPFDGSSASLERFGSKWSTLGWAGGSKPKGEDVSSGWRPKDSYPTLNGAYYNPTIADPGWGIAAVATMAAGPGSGHYFSLWLDMPTPSGTKAGYELRFTETNVWANEYTVTLSKWSGGTQTELASKTNYTFVNGNSLALLDVGGTVSAWTDTGSGFVQRLAAADSSFSEGNAGVSGAGANARLSNFKAGTL